MSSSVTYPLCHRFGLSYSAFEDRLILSTELPTGQVRVLLTRNIVIKMIKNLLTHLPTISKLDKTPHALWQEALSLSHQQAIQQHDQTQKLQAATSLPSGPTTYNVNSDNNMATIETKLYLATDVNSQPQGQHLLLGLVGLAVPQAMLSASPHTPILALTLETQHLHQLLQMFLNKATEAQWNIPLDLPWMVEASSTQGMYSH